jgi:hypothetical protein
MSHGLLNNISLSCLAHFSIFLIRIYGKTTSEKEERFLELINSVEVQ